MPTAIVGWALVACGVAYVAAVVLTFAGAMGAGADIIVAVNVALMVLAWRTYWTLTGWVSWRQLGARARIGLPLAYLMGYLVVGIVLVQLAIRAHWVHVAELEVMPQRIAELEAEFGIGQPPAGPANSQYAVE